MQRLSNTSLRHLKPTVIQPRYDRTVIQSGIVHIGIGNFHRAHQAIYTDDALNSGDMRWGITGISLRRTDIRDSLAPQDGLYSVGIQSDTDTRWRVIGAVRNVIFAPEDPRSVLDAIASAATRIISLTVTEKAYCLDAKLGTLDETHLDVIHDIANPEHPKTVLGFLLAGLAIRHARQIPFPTLLCCDNLTSNGKKLRAALIRLAECQQPKLANILFDQLLCPSTMVDRIVPRTTDRDREVASQSIGLRDAWPVMTEPFTQWVIEDRFALERPEWDRSGAEFVTDVTPYERMKLSLLNASHTALAILGLLSGYQTVSEAMNDKALGHFISQFMRDDIAPVLTLPAHINVTTYIHALLSRFRNPALHHHLLQIASDSSQKIPQRFMPSIFERLRRGLPLGRFAYAIAGFVLLLENSTASDGGLSFSDPERENLMSLLNQAGSDDADKLRALLHHNAIFGALGEHDGAIRELLIALSDIRQNGIQAALKIQTP